MSDVVRRPAFAAAEIDRQRSPGAVLAQGRRRRPRHRGQPGDRPAGVRLPSLRPAVDRDRRTSLSGLTRDDFVAFHKAWFVPNNALIALVGAVQPAEAFAQVRAGVRRLAARRGPRLRADRPAAAGQARGGHRQAGLGADRDPRRPPGVSAQASGSPGDGSGGEDPRRRGRQPAAAGAAHAEEPHLRRRRPTSTPTRWPGRSSPRPTPAPRPPPRRCARWSTSSSRLQRERVYEGELEGAQNFLAGSFPLSIESPDAIATRVLNQLFYDLPLEDLPAYPERVRSVTPDDIQRVAKAWLRPAQLSVVLVGDAAKFLAAARRRRLHHGGARADRGARPGLRRPAPPASRSAVARPHVPGDALVRRAVRRPVRGPARRGAEGAPPRHRRLRLRRPALRTGRHADGRPLHRAVGDRAHRGAAGAAGHLRDAAPPGAGGA